MRIFSQTTTISSKKYVPSSGGVGYVASTTNVALSLLVVFLSSRYRQSLTTTIAGLESSPRKKGRRQRASCLRTTDIFAWSGSCSIETTSSTMLAFGCTTMYSCSCYSTLFPVGEKLIAPEMQCIIEEIDYPFSLLTDIKFHQ